MSTLQTVFKASVAFFSIMTITGCDEWKATNKATGKYVEYKENNNPKVSVSGIAEFPNGVSSQYPQDAGPNILHVVVGVDAVTHLDIRNYVPFQASDKSILLTGRSYTLNLGATKQNVYDPDSGKLLYSFDLYPIIEGVECENLSGSFTVDALSLDESGGNANIAFDLTCISRPTTQSGPQMSLAYTGSTSFNLEVSDFGQVGDPL